MANLQYVLHKGNKNTGSLKFVQPEAMQAVLEFHSGIAGYAQTPLVSLPNLAKQLGVGQIFVKDESTRFGLNAFKALGGSYAIARYLCGKLKYTKLTETVLMFCAAKKPETNSAP